jgi:anthranilate phosphoribosyltransferase
MSEEHCFAQYVRILGRGPGRSRALTREEARDAMRMIIAGEAEPAQIGALLMLMRYRQESPEELAGFVEALRESIVIPAPRPRVDLDWPSYAAGRTRGEPWFLLSALLLAENGLRVLLHGPGRTGSALVEGLTALGLPGAGTDIERGLEDGHFRFLPLRAFCPALQRLLDLRRILGLRSAANSVARLINPFGASSVMQGVFHPAYRDLQRSAAMLLGQRALAVFKGGGGEAERNPDKPCRVFSLRDGGAFEEEWPALAAETTPQHAADAGHPLLACWRGRMPEAARIVIATAAVALRLSGRADSPRAADDVARRMWDARDRSRYPRPATAPAEAAAE